jgi:hypothetical protein
MESEAKKTKALTLQQCFFPYDVLYKAKEMCRILICLKALELCLDILEPVAELCPPFHIPIYPSFNLIYAE